MGAENGDAAGRHFIQLVDEIGALGAQAFDDMTVVDDLVPDIDRRAEFIDGALDDLDRALDAGAKTTGLCEDNLHGSKLFGPLMGLPNWQEFTDSAMQKP